MKARFVGILDRRSYFGEYLDDLPPTPTTQQRRQALSNPSASLVTLPRPHPHDLTTLTVRVRAVNGPTTDSIGKSANYVFVRHTDTDTQVQAAATTAATATTTDTNVTFAFDKTRHPTKSSCRR